MRGQRRQAIVRLFERDLLLVAHQPAQEVGRERAAGEELGVRAAVRHAGEGVRRVVDDLGHVLGVEAADRGRGTRPSDRSRATGRASRRSDACLLPRRSAPSDLPTYFSSSWLVLDPLHDQVLGRPPTPAWSALSRRSRLVGLALDRRAQLGIRILAIFSSVVPVVSVAPRRARRRRGSNARG